MHRHAPQLYAGFIAALLLHGRMPACAQDERESEIAQWLAGYLSDSAALPNREPVFFDISTVRQSRLTSSQLAALGREIEGKPDHPRRHEHAREQYSHREGGQKSRLRAWWARPGECRVSYDIPSVGQKLDGRIEVERSYDDCVLSGDTPWMLSPDSLTIIDVGKGFPALQDFSVREGEAARSFAIFFTLGLQNPGLGDLAVDRVEIEGDTWTAVLSSEVASVEMSGGWDPADHMPIARARTVLSAKEPLLVRHQMRYESWRNFGPGLDRAPTRIEAFDATGKLTTAYTLGEARGVTPGEFNTVCKLPKAGGEDPVRGAVTAAVIEDHRIDSVFQAAEASAVRIGDLPPTTRQRNTLRTTGWVMAACVLGALGFLWARRRGLILRRNG